MNQLGPIFSNGIGAPTRYARVFPSETGIGENLTGMLGQLARKAAARFLPSFKQKRFLVDDPNAIIRDDNLSPMSSFPGPLRLPAGRNAMGQFIIPVGSTVQVSRVQIKNGRVWVFAAKPENEQAYGWTSPLNFRGRFYNETLSLAKAPPPMAIATDFEKKTVVDKEALLRDQDKGFRSTEKVIPRGSLVLVLRKEPSATYEYVRVAEVVEGQVIEKQMEGWTAVSNMQEGWADIYGPHAAWRYGNYLGQIGLANIVGTGGEVKQVAEHTLEAYLSLVRAAANDNILISLNSGFRPYGKQAELKRTVTGSIVAAPGWSNHQHGQAFDLRSWRAGKKEDNIDYQWLEKNATRYGFVRTVESEGWHWEYRPDDAERLRKAGLYGTWMEAAAEGQGMEANGGC